jgi:phenylacetate-coenzyme A ligase PaaK-like adenylate-forming protein
MWNKLLFVAAHELGNYHFYPFYKQLVRNQWRPYTELKAEQEKALRHMVRFAYENVPYYHTAFRERNVQPDDIRVIEDLKKLPIITKQIIREHWEEFKPHNLDRMKYTENATGGTSGTPFTYRLGGYDRFISAALTYRGWGYAGYQLGDRMILLAGTSLGVGKKSRAATRFEETLRNIKKRSSFDMSDAALQTYADNVNSFKPKFVRGYPSALHVFAQWIEENGVDIHAPKAAFTTSEKLFPRMRRTMERVFGCDVYDGYGLNDGGLSSYECGEHCGMHVDTERGVMEVIDENGRQIDDGEGRILATALYNYTMPFIRYETEDIGALTADNCPCGRGYRLLSELVGKSVDVLITPEGTHVHGWFFATLLEHAKGVREYQVVQDTIDTVTIRIVCDEGFDSHEMDVIRKHVIAISAGWNVQFTLVDRIDRTQAGKHKYIVNRVTS